MKKKKIVNLLALDIDGVLNNEETHKKLNSVPDIRELSLEKQSEMAMELGVKCAIHPSYPDHFMGHVDLFKQQSLSKVCKHNNVDVLGISSWFVASRMDNPEVNDYMNEFFGLNIIAHGFSGSANGRLNQVAKYIEENYNLDEVEVNLVYLDDDCRINAEYKEGYTSLNLDAYKFLTNEINTLFIFPYANTGVLPKHIKLMGQFWGANSNSTPVDSVMKVPANGNEPIYKKPEIAYY